MSDSLSAALNIFDGPGHLSILFEEDVLASKLRPSGPETTTGHEWDGELT